MIRALPKVVLRDAKDRVAAAFTARASTYDAAANVQSHVARALAARIGAALPAPPARILEIGCGTGLLSAELAMLYPRADLLLTDISDAMLACAKARLGTRASYRHMDGEYPDRAIGHFDLIASSLAMQWFGELRGGIARLAALLAPGGQFHFATLGSETFVEWRSAHAGLGLVSGLHDYPSMRNFPWPENRVGAIDAERFKDRHADGRAFLRSLKAIGAGSPVPGHTPLTISQLRRVLDRFARGHDATYHVIYGSLRGG